MTIRPEDVPAELVEVFGRAYLAGLDRDEDNPVRHGLAAALGQAATGLEERLQAMREDGDADIRTAIGHVREVLRGGA